jgi:hypothetical protein
MTSTELFEKYNCVYGYIVSVIFNGIPSFPKDSPPTDVAVFYGPEKDVQGFIDVLTTDFFNSHSAFIGKKYDYTEFMKNSTWSYRRFPVYKLF